MSVRGRSRMLAGRVLPHPRVLFLVGCASTFSLVLMLLQTEPSHEGRESAAVHRYAKPGSAAGARSGNWPTIFYLGVPKAGSTSLFFFLQNHPHVCAGHQQGRPDLVNKEVDFFIKPDLFEQGPELYLSYFDQSEKCRKLSQEGERGVFVDASTKYLLDVSAAKRMKETYPPELLETLKFLVVLREPVERDRSWQGQKARIAGKRMSDDEYVHSVQVRTQNPAMFPELRHGVYDELLRGWWKHFRRDQFLVLSYDTLLANQTDTLARILSFLELDPGPVREELSLSTWNTDPNKHAVSPLRELHPRLCSAMAALYAGHNEALYRIVNEPGKPPAQPHFPNFRDPCQGAAPAR